MFYWLTLLVGKIVRAFSRLRGGGSALPGLVVERMNAKFVPKALAQLPHGVVVISGTNGKTTTTKIVTELLESQGLKVFTNKSGSNFIRGIASALLGELSFFGKLDADIAVLELDEAHAVHFVRQVPPKYSLLLNVLRDQLDRFGEIDKTAQLLQKIAEATTDTVVVNREDTHTRAIGERLADSKNVIAYGLSPQLRSLFPNDDEMYAGKKQSSGNEKLQINCVLENLSGTTAEFSLAGAMHTTSLQLTGVYNTFNAAAALCLVQTILGDTLDETALFTQLSAVQPAFGRGETVMIGGTSLELVLVKNPSGFRLALSSFLGEGVATMIAINDDYADGRDVSWLWDVDFRNLAQYGAVATTGTRAYDIALRLEFDDVPLGHIEPNLQTALDFFLADATSLPKRIFCTYTAMLAIREQLSAVAELPKGVSA